jgi:PhnB protein
MQCNPHLSFNGQCEPAFRYYQKHLRGAIELMMKYGDSPMANSTPPDWRDKILHASLSLGNQELTGGDPLPGSYQKPQGIAVLLNIEDAEEADRIFGALAENGLVQMPIEKTFWAERFGMVVDQFGIPWMINCGSPA